jgi:hypothetical protein
MLSGKLHLAGKLNESLREDSAFDGCLCIALRPDWANR